MEAERVNLTTGDINIDEVTVENKNISSPGPIIPRNQFKSASRRRSKTEPDRLVEETSQVEEEKNRTRTPGDCRRRYGGQALSPEPAVVEAEEKGNQWTTKVKLLDQENEIEEEFQFRNAYTVAPDGPRMDLTLPRRN